MTLVRLARVYRRSVDRRLAEHGLSQSRALPVLFIARLGEGVNQRDLAEEIGIEGPTLVRLLDAIARAGLVERRPDPRDGRAKALYLTDAGREMAVVVEQILASTRQEFLADISTEDLAVSLRVLDTFEAAIAANEP